MYLKYRGFDCIIGIISKEMSDGTLILKSHRPLLSTVFKPFPISQKKKKKS